MSGGWNPVLWVTDFLGITDSEGDQARVQQVTQQSIQQSQQERLQAAQVPAPPDVDETALAEAQRRKKALSRATTVLTGNKQRGLDDTGLTTAVKTLLGD